MADRPNVIVVLSDQQRWDTVGAYGQPLGSELNLTPNLDAMAAEGTRFERAFTMQPVCGPARSCLQTSQYATQTGCVTNNVALPLDADTIAKRMTAAGYETAYIGKWHLASDKEHNFRTKPVPPERRGGYADRWLAADVLEFTSHGYEGYMYDQDMRRVDFEGYRVDCTFNFVFDYLTGYASRRDRPFFMFASIIEPHQQNDLDRFIGPIGSKQRFADYPVPGDLVGTTPAPGRRADWSLHMPDYLGCCWSLDQNMGRLREHLNTLGLEDNTVVLYTSDHGCHFCTRNGEYKRSCHESSIRVPMIATGPGFTGGQVIEPMASLLDVPTTVLHAGGVEPGPKMQGRALQTIVDGSAADTWRDDIFVQISESQTGRALRTDRWKYCINAPDVPALAGSSDHYVEQHLYDLDADPHERTNLVAEPSLASVRAELADRLRSNMSTIDDVPDFKLEPAADA